MDEEELLTVPETAKILGLTQGGLRNALYRGALPFVEKYGRKLISEKAIKDYQKRVGIVGEGRPPRFFVVPTESREGPLDSPGETFSWEACDWEKYKLSGGHIAIAYGATSDEAKQALTEILLAQNWQQRDIDRMFHRQETGFDLDALEQATGGPPRE